VSLNESDTRAQLIDPLLNGAGWTRSQVTREHYYRPDWEYTAGRIVLRGDRTERLPPRRVDYLLRYTESFPIAVVEAKEEGKSAVSGLEQVKGYAYDLGLAFAYATNGREIIEWDIFTNTTRTIEKFPNPDELWKRWIINTNLGVPSDANRRPGDLGEIRPMYDPRAAAARRRNPLLHPYASPDLTRGKIPRYFQEVAIKESILRMMRGQKRMLLTMATGTGKTFVAFQIVWKLVKSGWLYHRENEQPARVLFLADRVVLRDQAYNAFSAFATSQSDPRFLLDGQKRLSLNRDLYFAIYQNLWAEEKGKRIFEQFPPDFFDLVIIDEAHRSGFGTWKDILEHFDQAIHIGMTATPKQDENIDTYAYFCQEEPTIAVDLSDDSKGTIHPPAYSYSLGQGIEDGFLATYKVHRIFTNIDKEGLNIQEAIERGAEVFVPEDAKLHPEYFTPQYEREIRLPDRTKVIVNHLAQLLRRFGVLHKTMVFCVDMAHAQEVARLLNNAFSDLGYGEDYAVPIVSEEGEQGRRWLNQFQDSDRKLPVVATTAELLSTGVDVPSARNIVFMKTLSSPLLFKQIIGRGSRVDPDTGKFWFRIIDYTGATRLFDPRWDRPQSPGDETQKDQPQTAALTGFVHLADSGEVLVGVNVAVIASPNDQRGPVLTNQDGRYNFEQLPAAEVLVMASGPGLERRQAHVFLSENASTTLDIELKPVGERHGIIQVRGLQVTIAEEATFIVSGMDEPMTLEAYKDYSRHEIIRRYPEWLDFAKAWQDPFQRQELVEQLDKVSVRPEVLTEVLEEPEVDEFDLLAHLAYGRTLHTRWERSQDFQKREKSWLSAYPQPAQEVILALLHKYELGGIRQITDPNIFRVTPFHEMGELGGILSRFGGDTGRLHGTINEIQHRLYTA
jgi:type I restriction enzyme R subunit